MGDPKVECKSTDDTIIHKPLIIFGKDVREIKCFRKSFICGFCLGLTGGLTTFLFTSKTVLSTNVAFASLWIGVFGYWFPCRYKYETSVLRIEKLKKDRLQIKNKSES